MWGCSGCYALYFCSRKDVGQRKRLDKGDVLSIFINDIENITNR